MENRIEREISLSNLFWKLLLGWRRWLAAAIIFAILIATFDYVRDSAAYKNAMSQQEKIQQGQIDETISLTVEEQEEVDTVKELQKTIAKTKEYMDNSIRMNLNPYEEKVLVLQYYVDSEYTFNYTQENENDYTDEVLASYCNYVTSGAMVTEICNQAELEISEAYLQELISSSSNADTFQIIVIFNETEMLEQLSNVIQTVVENQTSDIAKQIGSHSLKLLSINIKTQADTSLATQQKTQSDALSAYRTQLTSLKDALTEAQLTVLNMEIQQEEAEEGAEIETDVVVPVSPSFSVKMLILGFIVGVFLACVWIVLEVLFTSKIQEAKELSDLFGVRMIGELHSENPKKKFLGIIDSVILKMKNRNKKQLTREQQFKIICSNIEIACKKVGVDKVYLTGSEIEKLDSQWISEIKELLAAAGITAANGENISYDAKSLKEMAETGYVVFMEQVGISLYNEVEKEVRTARENSVEIVGSIVIV